MGKIVFISILFFLIIQAACKQNDTKETQNTVVGIWRFFIVTTSGNGENALTFSAGTLANDTAGTFIDMNGHGGPWHLENFVTGDSIYWEYTTGSTLPPGLINRIRGAINDRYDHITATSQGVYNNVLFTGTWEGVKN